MAKAQDQQGSLYTWYCESNDNSITIWANFHESDPNRELTEINVRKACFYPEKAGVNYITVCSFQFRQAATPWAPPTAEQVGMAGTNWSKGWVIENNIISDSKCTGITLGKDRASGQNVAMADPSNSGTRSAAGIRTKDPKPTFQTMFVDIEVPETHEYTLALYFLDWDTKGRRVGVQMIDPETLKQLAPMKVVSDYQGGKYLIYKWNRSLRVRISTIKKPNATLSGLFFSS